VTVRRLLYLVAFAAATFSARGLAAQQTDVVRGKVIGPDSVPLPGVLVAVTSISGNVSRQSRTDRNGNFSITFPNGDGDYMVSFSAMGFSAKRFEVKRTADQDVLLADAKLSRSAVQLDAMKVQQDRNKPNRNDAMATDISGSERGLSGGVLGADQMGDLAAMAGSLPGFTYIPPSGADPGGFSVFGLDPSQNLTTLNGMPFGGNNLPRDAGVSSSVSTSPYDVARGGFSGGSINLRTQGGNNYARRNMSFLGQAPQATWTDAAGRATGAAQTYGSLGGRMAGPIRFNKAFYNFSYQLNNTTHDLQSLLNSDPVALTTAGVAPDSVRAALNLISLDKIPFRAGAPDNSLNRGGSVFGSFDVTPPSSNVGAAYNVTYNGSYNKNTPSFLQALDLPSRGGDQSNWTAGVSGRHNAYFGFGVLTETSLGTSASGNEMNPYLRLPSGSVRVSSDLGGASPVVRNLGFGGNQARSTSNTLQQSLMNTLSWFSENNKHRLKMTTELNYSHSSSSSFANQFGTFTYQSLTDLAANAPSSFTRQLTPRETSIGNLVGGWSFGDSYRPNQDLQVQYGVRLDGNHFMSLPTSNPLVEQTFGRRNDNVPTPVYFSPRIGFTKTLGTAPDVVAFDGMFRAPRAVISGGIGLFQNAPNTGVLSQAISNNGLASGVQQLTCIGSATPVPDWNLYMQYPDSAPSVCANGIGASPFASSAPNVSLFAKNYVAPRSARSNLSWRGVTLGDRLQTSLNGTVSYNLNQASSFDLNFNPTQQFALAEEGNRPVYVQTSSIVPASGLISASDARVSQSFNRVNEIRSDLTSLSEQFQLSISPYYTWNYNWSWSANYTLMSTRDQQRGFTSTAGDPRDVAWGRNANDTRHQLGYTFRYLFFGMLNFNWNQSFRSGAPFTPMIAGDVNGDGYFNDRAFVFNPATATDPAMKAGMQSLLATGSSAAKTCLSKELGLLAARNTCEGPWTSTASLGFSLDPVKTHMPQRARVSFNLSNPLAAVDLAMHGESKLHGWGQSPSPDQSLLFVRGFDATNKRYIYEVNQRFGSTSLQQTLSRSPVRLIAQVSFDIGPTTERQSLSQQLDRGRGMLGAKYTEQMWKMMYSSGPVLNPLRQILTQADSLELTRVQADSLASLNRWYTIHLDSIWTPIGKYLADLPDHYDRGEAYARYREGRQASVDLLIKIAPTIKSLLTPAQMRKLGFVGPYLDTRYLASIRSSTAGGFGMAMMGGGGDIGAMTAMSSGSGGGSIVIIR
jgi:Carboxypeptidase regulatory-like domain